MFKVAFELLAAVASVLDAAAGTGFAGPLAAAGGDGALPDRAFRQRLCARAFWQGLLDGHGAGQGSGGGGGGGGGLLPGMAAACRRLAEEATAQAEQDAVLRELATSAIMCLNPACQVWLGWWRAWLAGWPREARRRSAARVHCWPASSPQWAGWWPGAAMGARGERGSLGKWQRGQRSGSAL